MGGGFAGLAAARGLARTPASVTLVDRRNFHLFQPLLYQVATGGLSPGDIASPLRHLVRRDRRTEVLLGEVTGIDPERRVVALADRELPYDTLLLATGSGHHYFGNAGWQAHAPGLKTVEDAIAIRHRVLYAFEAAERAADPEARRAWLNFVVVGAGPTGVELAGALGEIANDTLRSDFRHIDPTEARILLVEGMERVLPALHPDLSRRAAASLARLGVSVRTGTLVTSLGPGHATLAQGGAEQRVATRTILWAAGVRAHPLGAALAAATGTPTDSQGRVRVGPDLSLPGQPEVFVAGDLARVDGPDGEPLPGLAPVALQQGRHVARVVAARLAGEPPPPYTYRRTGTMATIGRGAAVAEIGKLRLGGFPAWMAWLFVHLLGLVEPENRLIVLFQWGWSFLTRNRGARLITGQGPDNA